VKKMDQVKLSYRVCEVMSRNVMDKILISRGKRNCKLKKLCVFIYRSIVVS